MGGTFAALRIRPFRVLWFGTLLSFVAFFMSTVVQSVVAFELTGTNRSVGLVVFAQGVAMAVLVPLGGALADRWPKRRVIVAGQLVTASVFGAIASLLATDLIAVRFLVAGALLMGATFAFLGPARQALVVDLVPARRRGNAMAVNTVANTASRVLGPALAGAFLGWPRSGATGAYVAMTACYLISAASIAWLPRSVVRAGARERPVFADLGDGLRYVASQPRLRLLLIFFVTVILTGFPHVTMLPGLVENAFGRDSAAVSSLYLAAALGALVSSVSVARFADSPRAWLLYAALAIAFGSALVALSRAPSFRTAAAVMVAVGAASGGFQALNAAIVARETEPAFIGRVMSLTLMAFAGFGLMAWPLGALADAIGERATLSVMGAAVIALSIALGGRLVLRRAD